MLDAALIARVRRSGSPLAAYKVGDYTPQAVADLAGDFYFNTISRVERISNGTFDTDTTGWTADTNSVLSSVGGELKLASGGAVGTARAYQNATGLTSGYYRFRYDITAFNGFTSAVIRLGTGIANAAYYDGSVSTPQAVDVVRQIAATNAYVTLQGYDSSGDASKNMLIDDVFLEQVGFPLAAGTYDVRIISDSGTTDLLSQVYAGGTYWPATATDVVETVSVFEEGALA